MAYALKCSLLISLVIFMVMIFAILGSRYSNINVDSVMLRPALLPKVFSVLALISKVLFIFVTASDGLLNFDSSLRFGISRNSYVKLNLIIFAFLTIVYKFFDSFETVLLSGTYGQYFNEALSNLTINSLLLTFMIGMCYAISSYLYYRFGWKAAVVILVGFLVAPMISGVAAALFAAHYQTPTYVATLIEFILDYKELFYAFGAVILVGIYNTLVHKVELTN